MVGTNHEHAPIETRERLWCHPEILPSRLKSLVHDGTREAVILSTCNRTEIYILTTTADSKIVTEIQTALSRWSGIEFTELERSLYVLTGEDAVRHLVSVATGLDSLAVGEQQVQDQVTSLASRKQSRNERTLPFRTVQTCGQSSE